nr:MAG TPA: hypothetical protein [Caudoviricetes sp.]
MLKDQESFLNMQLAKRTFLCPYINKDIRLSKFLLRFLYAMRMNCSLGRVRKIDSLFYIK